MRLLQNPFILNSMEGHEKLKGAELELLRERFKKFLGYLKDRGIDQVDIAEAARSTPSLVSEAKHGPRFSLRSVIAIAIGLKLDVVELLGGVYLGEDEFDDTRKLAIVLRSRNAKARSLIFGSIHEAHRMLVGDEREDLLKKDLHESQTSATGN